MHEDAETQATTGRAHDVVFVFVFDVVFDVVLARRRVCSECSDDGIIGGGGGADDVLRNYAWDRWGVGRRVDVAGVDVDWQLSLGARRIILASIRGAILLARQSVETTRCVQYRLMRIATILRMRRI